ncbi:unnamed protein product, partial [Prunus brigantina]
MCGNEYLHLGHGRAPKDDIVGCWAVNNEEGSGDCSPLGCCSNRYGEMNASNRLDHLTIETHQGCNAPVEVRLGWEIVHVFVRLPFANKSLNDVAQ